MTKKSAKKNTAPKPAAAAAGAPASPGGFGSKTKFILSFPSETPAKEIVEKAKENGVEFSEKYVYVVRSNAKLAANKRSGQPQEAVKSRVRSGGTSGGQTEAQLRKIIAELGLARARQVFSEVETAFGGQ